MRCHHFNPRYNCSFCNEPTNSLIDSYNRYNASIANGMFSGIGSLGLSQTTNFKPKHSLADQVKQLEEKVKNLCVKLSHIKSII